MKYLRGEGYWVGKKEQGGTRDLGSQFEQSCRGDNESRTMGRDMRDLMSFAGCRQGFYICFGLLSSQCRVVAGLVAGSGVG